jgi:hypothetical protein
MIEGFTRKLVARTKGGDQESRCRYRNTQKKTVMSEFQNQIDPRDLNLVLRSYAFILARTRRIDIIKQET